MMKTNTKIGLLSKVLPISDKNFGVNVRNDAGKTTGNIS